MSSRQWPTWCHINMMTVIKTMTNMMTYQHNAMLTWHQHDVIPTWYVIPTWCHLLTQCHTNMMSYQHDVIPTWCHISMMSFQHDVVLSSITDHTCSAMSYLVHTSVVICCIVRLRCIRSLPRQLDCTRGYIDRKWLFSGWPHDRCLAAPGLLSESVFHCGYLVECWVVEDNL